MYKMIGDEISNFFFVLFCTNVLDYLQNTKTRNFNFDIRSIYKFYEYLRKFKKKKKTNISMQIIA